MVKPVNLDKVRAARKAAVRVGVKDAAPADDDKPIKPDGLPPDCPVIPLGVNGKMRYYLDSSRQLIALLDKEHTRLGLSGLFSKNKAYPYAHWPRHNKEGTVVGWRPELLAEDLMRACALAGNWDPTERERGRGAWRGADEELMLHVGSRVHVFPRTDDPWRDQTVHDPGLIGRHVYPSAEGVGAPAEKPQHGGSGGPGEHLLQMLETWNWKRTVDPVLLLGWIGAAMIGGALDWRAVVWLTGGSGAGKSTLQRLLSFVMDQALLKIEDASAASIWQALKKQSLPVALDETEAEEDNRKIYALVKLARVAASGAKLARGTADHAGVEFTVRSQFIFSSILIPPLSTQDRNRMAILELQPLSADAPVPDLVPATWREIGARLRRRMIQGWPRLDRTLAWYRSQLHQVGHSARGQDQFGTLLACADLLMFDGEPSVDDGGAWVAQLVAQEMNETEDISRDENRCLMHLLSTAIDAYRNGTRMTVAEWVRQAAGVHGADPGDSEKVLGTFGMRVVNHNGRRWLAVANDHQELVKMFAPTHWAGRSGALGPFVQALRRLPEAEASKPLYFGGVICRSTLLPLELVVPAAQAAAASLEV